MASFIDKDLEKVARVYCKGLRIDPDSMQSRPHEKHPTLAVTKPAWQWVLPQVKSAIAMSKALEELKEAQ